MPPLPLNQVSNTGGQVVNTAITIPSGANRMIVVGFTGRGNVAGANPAINTCILASTGLGFTRLRQDSRAVGGLTVLTEIWYYMNPAPGADTVTWTTFGVNVSTGAWIYTCTGVNQTTPWRDGGSGANGNSANPSTNQTSMPNDLVVDICHAVGFPAMNAGAGQTAFGARYAMIATVGNGSYEPGASPTVTMSWTLGAAGDWIISTGSITPAVEFRSRAFKYYIDLLQNPPVILDEKGAKVHPSEVESDCWSYIRDEDAPTVIQTDTFIDDDRMFYNEEVIYDEESDKLTIRNNRQQQLDVVIARKGSGGLI